MTKFSALFASTVGAALLVFMGAGAGQAVDSKVEVKKFEGTWYS